MSAQTVADLMDQPSTHYEPTDPPTRIRRVVDAAEFNRLAWRADVEYDGDYAVAVIGDVEYAVALGDEVTC